MHAIIFVAVSTGMRLCELLRLRWSDLNLDPLVGTAHVVRAVQYLPETGVTFGTPKTAKSRRTVALSAETVRVLREHRTPQLEARLALGEAYEDGDLVFPHLYGKPVRPSDVSHRFRTAVKRAGLCLGIANTRLKDFYDVWALSRSSEFGRQMLSDAIRATFERRATPLPVDTPSALQRAFGEQGETQWRPFLRRVDAHGASAFVEVIEALQTFLAPMYETAGSRPQRWDPEHGWI